MPALVLWIGEMLLSVVGQLAISAFLSIGIGFAANAVAPSLIDSSGIKAMIDGSGEMTKYFGWFGMDQAITIVLSAWAGRAVMSAARLHFTNKRAATT